MSKRILLIEDDIEISELLSVLLTNEGFVVTPVYDGISGEERALEANHDVIILDIMLPQKNGLAVLKDIRSKINTPILMLTAKGEDIDRIIGFEVGADDYLPKPFNPRELIARINALLRRVEIDNISNTPHAEIQSGSLKVNNKNRQVTLGVKNIDLTTTEFDVLFTLMSHLDEVVSKERLTEQALGRKLSLYDRAIDMHVSNLRKKIPDCQINTIRGIGYMLLSPQSEGK